jgi:hypothetical protein
MLLVFVLIALASAEPRSASVKPAAADPAYFADQAGRPVRPLTAPIDLKSAEFLSIETPDGPLHIAYRDIRSLSYAAQAFPSDGAANLPAHRLLTIGFSEDNGKRHNLVVQLDRSRVRETLKLLSKRTGLQPAR